MKSRFNSYGIKVSEPLQAAANKAAKKGMIITDNRPAKEIQRKEINTGPPDDDTPGIGSLSGIAMNNVSVKYNNYQPLITRVISSYGNIVQRVVDNTNGKAGDRVIDDNGEEFILVRWSETNQGWHVERVDPSRGAKSTFRDASELDPIKSKKEKQGKRKKDDDSPSSSSALLPPAPTKEQSSSASATSKIIKKQFNPSLLSFGDELEPDEGKEITKFKRQPTPHAKTGGNSSLKTGTGGLGEPRSQIPMSSSSFPSMSSFSSSSSSSLLTPYAPKMTESSVPKAEKPIEYPDVSSIVKIDVVSKALRLDLMQSISEDRELGGYIFWNPASNQYAIVRAATGKKKTIDLDKPHDAPGEFILVANYHTHPNETDHQPPSEPDVQLSSARGIPSIVIASNKKTYFSGPAKRREGGERHNYPVPDPKEGYNNFNIPRVKEGEGGKELK